MSTRSLLLALLFVVSPAGGCQPQQPSQASPQTPALQTEQDKTFYALGVAIAGNLAVFGLTEQELELVTLGISDAVLERELAIDEAAYRPRIQALQSERRKLVVEEETAEATAFLEEAAGAEGAVRTDSGLIFVETLAGTGESPVVSSTVKVHYHGTLRDGSVFDSSVERGTPAEFPLGRVIPCWQEGLQKMKVGGKARIVCPPDIAYGERGAPPRIPGGAALAFDVELIEIVSAE